jgi:hypothetical protein
VQAPLPPPSLGCIDTCTAVIRDRFFLAVDSFGRGEFSAFQRGRRYALRAFY